MTFHLINLKYEFLTHYLGVVFPDCSTGSIVFSTGASFGITIFIKFKSPVVLAYKLQSKEGF